MASWGHEYIRSLSGEIGEEYHARREKGEEVDDLLGLVAQIVPFHMTHNAGKLLQASCQHCICPIFTLHPLTAANGSGLPTHIPGISPFAESMPMYGCPTVVTNP